MVPIKLTAEQAQKLGYLATSLAPHFLLRYTYHGCNYPTGGHALKRIDHEIVYVANSKDEYIVGWLEFCLTHLVPHVASKYVHDHIDCTQSWAERIISQKIAHEIGKVNPIDTLYDIYKNPQDYKQNL